MYLKAVTDLIPETSYLTTFRYREDKIELDGISDKASELIAILESSPYFAGVEFTAPTTKYLSSQERFSLRMRIEQ
jgi:general secretion pathway protein L